MVPISVFLGWVESVAFVAACSLYANAAAHWGAYEAAQAKDEASSDGTP